MHAYFISDDERIGDAAVRIELFDVTEPSAEPVTGLVSVDDLTRILRCLDVADSPMQLAANLVVEPDEASNAGE